MSMLGPLWLILILLCAGLAVRTLITFIAWSARGEVGNATTSFVVCCVSVGGVVLFSNLAFST